MSFEKVQKIIDDIVDFIISAVANMQKFIDGFKTTTKFETSDLA